MIVAEDHGAPVSSSAVVYRVSQDERAGRIGFAHLFAHMMLKGSENVWPGEHFYTNGHVGAGDAAGGLVTRATGQNS